MDLLYIWHDWKHWSKILFSTIPTPAYDLEIKVKDLEIYVKVCVKVFKISLFLNPCMELLYIWHDYRYWSKILFGRIPTPAYDLEVNVTDLKIYVKVLRQSF